MFKSNSIFAAAAIAAMLSTPVLALDMPADAVLGAAPGDMTVIKMIEDSAFVGNAVFTKDQISIGLVDAVYDGGDKGPMALISLKSDIASKSSVKTFTIPLGADMVADGALTLAWTEAELFTALSSELEPASN